jgi:hypothetical protein
MGLGSSPLSAGDPSPTRKVGTQFVDVELVQVAEITLKRGSADDIAYDIV